MKFGVHLLPSQNSLVNRFILTIFAQERDEAVHEPDQLPKVNPA